MIQSWISAHHLTKMTVTWKICKHLFILMLLISVAYFLLLINIRFQILIIQKLQAKSLKTDSSNLEYKLPSINAACPIFTYYETLPKSVDLEAIQKLEIWGYAFYAHGFYPIILDSKSLQTRHNLDELIERFSKFPTVNPIEYEISCYLRWVALAERGGGLLMDYDILPMASSQSAQMRQLKQCNWQQLTTYKSIYPMVTHGNKFAIEKWIEYMLNFNLSNTVTINNKPHISDMLMAVHAINHHDGIFTVKSSLPFFHYSHHAKATAFNHIKQPTTEMMTRFQHLYYFLHHDVYLPIVPLISPFSVEIVRSLTLCSDVIPSNDEIDLFCSNQNHLSDVCKLITIDGFWSPKDPINGKCRWKTGSYTSENFHEKKEPMIVAVLPEPEVYLCRLWLHESSLPHNREFQSWLLHQSKSSMLDALLPHENKTTDTNSRITHLIHSMRSGQALIMTEKFIRHLYQFEGIQGIETWISGHVGFFLNLTQLNMNWDMKSSVALNLTSFIEDDYRFYSAIEEENQRWTKHWNSWRRSFLH